MTIVKTIVEATPPNGIGFPKVAFNKNNYENAIWSYGYDVYWERACECPCKTLNSSPLSDCQNCLGTGYIFINPIKTRALMTSINRNTKYQQWSQEMMGTISVSVREDEGFDVGKIGYMDRLTLMNNSNIKNTSVFSEIKEVRGTTEKYIFLSYKPIKILDIFIFKSTTEKLIRLTEDDYSISTDNEYVIDLSYSFSEDFNGHVSINYEHQLQYHILDMPHDLRNSFKVNNNGKEEQLLLPINAIARKAHNVYEKANKSGTNLLDNSWLGVASKILLASEGELKISSGSVKISDVTI